MSWLRDLGTIWRPAAFHYGSLVRSGRPVDVFEGWYLKCVDEAGDHPLALIPGVFLGEDRHAFVQLLDGARGEAWYHRYSLGEFGASSRTFDVTIGDCHFGTEGVRLELDPARSGGGPRVSGALRFGPLVPWPVRPLSPGVMGPYGFTPFMQCNHGILGLDHTVSGALDVDGVEWGFGAGRGYVEKDWGTGFPLGYVWAQSNHFERPGTCVTASVATIPWVVGSFRGFLVGLLHDGVLHRFTTYTGAQLEELTVTDTHVHLVVAKRHHRLEIDARKAAGAVLEAPYERQMLERVAETMTSEVTCRFFATTGGGASLLWEGRGRHGCLEVQGDVAKILT